MHHTRTKQETRCFIRSIGLYIEYKKVSYQQTSIHTHRAVGRLCTHCVMQYASDELMYACGQTHACTVKLENKAVCFYTSDWRTHARPIHRHACVPERFFKTVEHSNFCLKLFVYEVDAPHSVHVFRVHKRTQLRVLAQCVCMLETVCMRITYIRSCVHSFVFFKS